MSYEGYVEYLCKKGHYFAQESYLSSPEHCSICKEEIELFHCIDHTNGVEEDNPNTYPAGRVQLGFKDKWLTDHYGNLYAQKIPIWKATGKAWQPYVKVCYDKQWETD